MLREGHSKNDKSRRLGGIVFIIALVVLVLFGGTFFMIEKARAPIKDAHNVVSSPATPTATLTPTPTVSKPKEVLSFTIAGDVMFDRAIDYNFRGDQLFGVVDSIKNQFGSTTLSMVNLEGPVSPTEIPADNTANNMSFYFPPKTPEVLKSIGINAVSLANNHTNNNGRTGLENTKKVLASNNIQPIGEENTFGDFSVGRFNSGEKKLSIITINSLEVSRDIGEEIKQEKNSGAKVIVFPHWGTEYEQHHNASQERLAHGWIDAGADMVIGGHPHVIQDMEVYNKKPIFYSLGNLIFDQTFSRETQEGLILKGRFEDNGLMVEIVPTISKKLKPEVAAGAEGDDILNSVITGFTDYQLGNYPRNILLFPYN